MFNTEQALTALGCLITVNSCVHDIVMQLHIPILGERCWHTLIRHSNAAMIRN
jgi:hypothetical protein